ncbi:MAG TPA: hypothetical protein VHY58_00715 [Streptosporangiaceae bacterium]|jgi:hypothetical protein|nr:hypothetical protein [Streptosporangiaceae bacterium]
MQPTADSVEYHAGVPAHAGAHTDIIIFAKLGLAPSDNDNRRVIAAIKYLES